MRLVSTSMLRPDMILAKSVYHRDCLILKAGQKDLMRYIPNLHNMGIEYIYIEDDKSQGIKIPDVISEETRVKCKSVLRDTIEKVSSQELDEAGELGKTINAILDEILYNKDVQISLNDICATDDYTFSHSVSATVYSLLLATKLNYSRSMLEKLAIGTLLHDVGKVLLDKEILFKQDELTNEEYEYVKQHTVFGYEMLRKCVCITELSRIIALSHHERMDGSGYPKGVKASELHEFARIVAIADVYDALTTDRCYRKKWSNERAVNYLMKYAGTLFDTDLVRVFIQAVAIYPNGSIVRLSNGHYGVIKSQNKNMPRRPIVRIFADEKQQDIDMYEIDLLENLSITIMEGELELNDDISF
ncbi:MAG: HD-GYP domain-containing protein [bacterium]|nr:HD-GYP domain-containing protein [bacterium]